MKSSHRLSISFDVEKLLEDLFKVESDWVSHFNTSNYEGEWSGLPLRGADDANHSLVSAGENASYSNTPLMSEMGYIPSILDQFQCEKTLVRLLKLTPGSRISEHTDPDLSFWNKFARIHIPILTNDQVQFTLDGEALKMKPGECWFGEFCKPHSVANNGHSNRIHLVVDLEVNEWLHELFIREGILEENETEPDPIENFDVASQIAMVKSLKEIGTETSLNLAEEIVKKFGLDLKSK